jgi:hypothetical protein
MEKDAETPWIGHTGSRYLSRDKKKLVKETISHLVSGAFTRHFHIWYKNCHVFILLVVKNIKVQPSHKIQQWLFKVYLCN